MSSAVSVVGPTSSHADVSRRFSRLDLDFQLIEPAAELYQLSIPNFGMRDPWRDPPNAVSSNDGIDSRADLLARCSSREGSERWFKSRTLLLLSLRDNPSPTGYGETSLANVSWSFYEARSGLVRFLLWVWRVWTMTVNDDDDKTDDDDDDNHSLRVCALSRVRVHTVWVDMCVPLCVSMFCTCATRVLLSLLCPDSIAVVTARTSPSLSYMCRYNVRPDAAPVFGSYGVCVCVCVLSVCDRVECVSDVVCECAARTTEHVSLRETGTGLSSAWGKTGLETDSVAGPRERGCFSPFRSLSVPSPPPNLSPPSVHPLSLISLPFSRPFSLGLCVKRRSTGALTLSPPTDNQYAGRPVLSPAKSRFSPFPESPSWANVDGTPFCVTA